MTIKYDYSKLSKKELKQFISQTIEVIDYEPTHGPVAFLIQEFKRLEDLKYYLSLKK